MRKSILVRPSLLAVAALSSMLGTAAHAADFKAGDWDLNVGGFINAYYTHTNCSGNQGITGLALAGQALGCGGTTGRTVIGNGLLPNALITTAKTQQEGIDISATIMIGAAVSSSDSISNNNNVDVRQGFMTFGTADMGTVKLGRDYGLFGQNAILNDMTLLGAGAPVNATQQNRVTLGHIGAGYTYLGHYGQLAYTTPSMGGVKVTAALYSPVDDWTGASNFIAKNQPQVQLNVAGDIGDGKWWAGYKHQAFVDSTNSANSFNMNGYEIGGKYTFGPVGLLANFQTGKGIGVLADGDAGNAKQRNALVQATFMVTPKTKLGLSWGQSRLKDGSGAALKSNANLTGGAYYNLTKSLTLVGELSRTESKPFAGEKAKMNGVAAGAILFF
jgi:predicted porin